MKKIIPLLLASSALGLSGCGGGGSSETTTGGGSSGSVAGLDMPVTLSVVTPKETASAAGREVMGLKANYKAVMAALTDPGTDYTKDPVNTHVFDKSVESLSTVNMILCVMDQTRAADMVNKGAYIALVNNAKCETGKNQSSSGQSGQSSGGQTVSYEKWTINSTRTDSSAPMIVKIWVPKEQKSGNTKAAGGGPGGGPNPMDEKQILVETTVTEAISAANPFGKFTLNFKGVVDGSVFNAPAGSEVAVMKGALFTVSNTAGKPEFKFIDVAGAAMGGNNAGMDFSREESSHVLLDDANGNTGQAMTHSAESFSYNDPSDNPDAGVITKSNSDTFAVAFNSANFLRQSDSSNSGTNTQETACTSRTDFNTNVWRYNLYHAADGQFNGKTVTAGQRVELDSGFPFTYNGKYGHVGYWGVWYEGGNLPDNTPIKQVDFSTGTSTDYTVHVAAGKLIRRVATSELLSQFQGMEFNYWGPHPVYTTYSGQWHVSYDGSNFKIVDRFEWGNSGPVSYTTIDINNTPTNTADDVAAAATITLTDGQSLGLWSDSLGGNINYVHKASTPTLERTVTLYSQDFVKPNDSTLTSGSTLYCYQHCLKGGLIQADITSASTEANLFYAEVGFDWTSNTQTGTPHQYTASISNGKLLLMDGSAVVSVDGLDLSKFGNTWGGMQTGQMLTTALPTSTPPWNAYQADVSYQWETGSNDWSHMVTVQKVSDSSYASFDKPLEFNYTHSTANDANGDTAFNGKKFRLNYGGPGELWGFPWTESVDGRWHASVTLADKISLTAGANSFIIKGMEKEQTMKDQALSACAALSVTGLGTTLPLPTASEIGTVSFSLSDKPSVTAAPAVIEGELQ